MWACQQEDSSNVFVILVILVRVAGVSLSKALNPPRCSCFLVMTALGSLQSKTSLCALLKYLFKCIKFLFIADVDHECP